MKRSEMIKILEEEFFKYDNFKSIAQKALSAVENNGMIPPMAPRGYDRDGLARKTPPQRKWEPEDEQ